MKPRGRKGVVRYEVVGKEVQGIKRLCMGFIGCRNSCNGDYRVIMMQDI
jgi:hypothetical protein